MIDTKMRQWWVEPGADGGVLALREVPPPMLKPGEALVRVKAAGVNRGELIASAALRTDNPAAKARPSGIECMGDIVAFGDAGAPNGWALGDRVMARGVACHADYTRLPLAALMPAPTDLSDAEVAAIPNVFVTAHDAMITHADLKAGEGVLITAGSSGVGTAAIQIARYLEADPILVTSRSPQKSEALLALGADMVIDTRDPDWPSVVRDASEGGVQVVIDQVGGGLFKGLMASLAVAGRYVSVGRNDGAVSEIDLDALARDRLTLYGVTFRTRSPEEALLCSTRFADDLLPAFERGRLQPVLDRSFPLTALPAAHDYMRNNEQVGKVVLITQPD